MFDFARPDKVDDLLFWTSAVSAARTGFYEGRGHRPQKSVPHPSSKTPRISGKCNVRFGVRGVQDHLSGTQEEKQLLGEDAVTQTAMIKSGETGFAIFEAVYIIALLARIRRANDGQNMFDALRLVALIHNQTGTDFNHWVTPSQALATATSNGARAFGLDAGELAPGKLADLVLLRRDTPAFTPLNDVMSQLVFCENGRSVDTVIVNGEVVVAEGRLKKLDEQEVLRPGR